MGFNCGIVGLPNVGKSTLFNALTKAGIAAENFPFCTIDPEYRHRSGTGSATRSVRGDRQRRRRSCRRRWSSWTSPGSVAGASKGEGLGNQFLAHIRETDAVAHVVRCFVDDNVVHVADEFRRATTSR